MEEVKKIKLSWKDIEDRVDELASKIKETMTMPSFDAVISIGRGGMIPARLLAEKFDIHTAYVIDAKAYTKDNKLGEVHISDINLNGASSILLVDDVIFTGTTLDAVNAKITECNPNVTYCINAFLYKNSKTTYNGYGYTYAKEYDGDANWLVFPWEAE